MAGPLSDLRVLDFSTLLPGPLATLFLAEAGAEVIKVERPGKGEEMRIYTPKWGEDSANFHLLNRGKKSIAIDMKDAAQREKLIPLVETADIIVEQFRPGVMARLGLDFETVKKINPDIIYCSISGYGQHGPNSARAGHDMNFIAEAGLLGLSHGPIDTPVLPPALIGDIAGGTYPAVFNILLALIERNKTGNGVHLDISMADNLFPFMYWAMADGQATGEWPGSGDALVTGGTCRYQLYKTSDDKLVAAAPIEQKFWDIFCETIDLPTDLRDDSLDPQATKTAVANLIAAQTAAHWDRIFTKADCCCSIVQTLQEALKSPHFSARGIFKNKLITDTGEEVLALPTPVADAFSSPNRLSAKAPRLGANNDLLENK